MKPAIWSLTWVRRREGRVEEELAGLTASPPSIMEQLVTKARRYSAPALLQQRSRLSLPGSLISFTWKLTSSSSTGRNKERT